MKVGEICDFNATTVCANSTLAEAAQLLSNSYIEAIVAIAAPVPRPTAIGIITYREVLNALVLGDDLKSMHVLDVLDANPLVLHEEESLEDAIARLRARGAKHAPVTGAGGTLRGVISMDRLLGCRAVTMNTHPAAIVVNTYK
jgi:CBS domain-containing protein